MSSKVSRLPDSGIFLGCRITNSNFNRATCFYDTIKIGDNAIWSICGVNVKILFVK